MSTGGSRSERRRLQLSPHIVSYWDEGRFLVRNYLEGTVSELEPQALSVLHAFEKGNSFEALARRYPKELHEQLAGLVDFLIEQRCLLRPGTEEHARARAARGWAHWSPVAGFFHFASRKVKIDFTPESPGEDGGEPEVEGPGRRPAAVKRTPGAPKVQLEKAKDLGELSAALHGRRTWREFSRKPLELHDVATLLQLTWGVERWATTAAGYRVPLKTSPSGGARHPIEVYLLALRVEGLSRGLYHYDAARHTLGLLQTGADARTVGRYIPGQPRFRSAAALFLMTGVFPRAWWRYKYPRAYRSVLLEAGHLCQTFCLVATSLGLAPFQTALFDDEVVERDMGVDGIDECFLYGAGVGHRPPGVEWAP